MLFLLVCLDRSGVAQLRADAMQAHRDFICQQGILEIVISGPLLTDRGDGVIGSMFIVEALDRATVEQFQKRDPLFQAGIWETIDIRAFDKRIDNRL